MRQKFKKESLQLNQANSGLPFQKLGPGKLHGQSLAITKKKGSLFQ